jgi:hypothetical protein
MVSATGPEAIGRHTLDTALRDQLIQMLTDGAGLDIVDPKLRMPGRVDEALRDQFGQRARLTAQHLQELGGPFIELGTEGRERRQKMRAIGDCATVM